MLELPWVGVRKEVLPMEYRQLGRSGLRVSALTLGTMTFGGRGGFRAVVAIDVGGARRQVDMCLDAGINLIDTADVYSGGMAEEITGEIITGRRDALLLSTKVRIPMGGGRGDAALSGGLELRRLADDEGTRRRRQAGIRTVRGAADLLLARSQGRRVRADSAG